MLLNLQIMVRQSYSSVASSRCMHALLLNAISIWRQIPHRGSGLKDMSFKWSLLHLSNTLDHLYKLALQTNKGFMTGFSSVRSEEDTVFVLAEADLTVVKKSESWAQVQRNKQDHGTLQAC